MWLPTRAGNQRVCSRASSRSLETYVAAEQWMTISLGSRPASAAPCRTNCMPPDEVRIGDLKDHAVTELARQRERARAVARDVDGHLRLRPVQLDLDALERHLLAARESADQVDGVLEVGELRRLSLHHPNDAVASADAADHAVPGDLGKGGEGARGHRRVAADRIRDQRAELHRLASRKPDQPAEDAVAVLPDHVRVVHPELVEARILGRAHDLERPRGRGVSVRDTELHRTPPLLDGHQPASSADYDPLIQSGS